jgi:hypothetical protein
LLIISVVGVVVQNIHGLVLADGMAVYGGVGVGITLLVLVIGIYLIWYAKGAKERGWIS